MSKSKKVENKNDTNVEMLNTYKRQHMIVRNFNTLTLTRAFPPSLLFLFSTFSFFGIFMFRHFYFRPKLGLPKKKLIKFWKPKVYIFQLSVFRSELLLKLYEINFSNHSWIFGRTRVNHLKTIYDQHINDFSSRSYEFSINML